MGKRVGMLEGRPSGNVSRIAWREWTRRGREQEQKPRNPDLGEHPTTRGITEIHADRLQAAASDTIPVVELVKGDANAALAAGEVLDHPHERHVGAELTASDDVIRKKAFIGDDDDTASSEW
jgi:hypothetical protein